VKLIASDPVLPLAVKQHGRPATTRPRSIRAKVAQMANSGEPSTHHTVNSSHTRLVTQSSRHKLAHNKATSRNFFSAARRSDSTLKQCSTRTAYLMAREHTTRHTQYRAVRFDYMGLVCAVSK